MISPTFVLTVHPAVAPTANPFVTPVTINYGESLNLQANVTGTPDLTFVWFKDGVVIPNVSGSYYGSFYATTADSGSYAFTVSNIAGLATSNNVVVTVLPPIPPSVTGTGGDVVLDYGSNLFLSATGSGTNPLSVSWTKDGSPVANSGSFFSITGATPADSGQYKFTASNPFGAASITWNVTIRPPVAPTITNMPAAIQVAVGETLQINPVVTGSMPMTYEWKRDGVSVVVTGGGAQLNKSSMTLADAGNYTLTVSNPGGSVESTAVQVTVVAASFPVINGLPPTLVVPFEGDLSLYPSITGSGPFTYQWTRDGVAIPFANSADYFKSSLMAGDAGNYTLTVTNPAGSTSLTVAVTVAAPIPPSVQFYSSVVRQRIGQFVGFNAFASGSPPLSYQWYFNGHPLAGATSSSVTYWSVSQEDAGQYYVVVTGWGGASVTSSTATLRILESGLNFASDSSAGLIWSDRQTGELRTWSLNGPAYGSEHYLGWAPLNLKFSGAGYFGSSDLSPKIIWTNQLTGDRFIADLGSFVTSYDLGVIPLAWRVGGVGDFNGDGNSDILWENTTTGEHLIWLMNGPVQSAAAEVGFVGTQWSVQGVADFNLDGKLDLLWRNSHTGEGVIWLMDGATQVGAVSLGLIPKNLRIDWIDDFNYDGRPDLLLSDTFTNERLIWLMDGATHTDTASLGIIPAEWSCGNTQTLSTGSKLDFNSDGQSDLLWENTSTGERYAWFMNGATFTAAQSLGTLSTDWHIAATGDFNGDGQADLVWENTATGERYLWLMNGAAFASAVNLGTLSTDWHIVAAADFNGDGQPDLVWENSSTGERYVWLMNGTAFSSAVNLGTMPTAWHIAEAADFTGDGQPDLVWENTATGERYLWLMNGPAYVSAVYLGTISTDWHIAAAADYNGDGQTDLVWQNTVTGERYLWFMTGTAYASGQSLVTMPVEWRIVP